MRQTGYPSGRTGYVVDHIIPLACGGPDTPENMQWQTIEKAKAKDRYERTGCQSGRAAARPPVARSPIERAAEAATPDAIGYAVQRPQPVRSPPVGKPIETHKADSVPARARETSTLLSDPIFRQAFQDARRLGIVTGYSEVRPGLLRLTLGPGFARASSAEYNLARFHRAYAAHLGFRGDPILELWLNGQGVGEYGRNGLLLTR